MKFDLISDVHLEFGLPDPLPGGELLVIAGDLLEVRNLFRNDSGSVRRTGKELRNWLTTELEKYKNVLYVPGNHEFYGRGIEETHDLLDRYVPSNTHIMRHGAQEFNGVWFIGDILWANSNDRCITTMSNLMRSMNDFFLIEDGHFLPSHAAELFDRAAAFIKTMVEEEAKGKPCVVITHHAPSFQSVAEEYKDDHYMNGGYASNLDAFILSNPAIKVWCHGHMHTPVDYKIGETRIVSNPRGYFGYESQAKDYKPLSIEV